MSISPRSNVSSPFRSDLVGAHERVRVLETEVAELRARLEGRSIRLSPAPDDHDRFGPETSWTRAGVVMAFVAIGALLVSEAAARVHAAESPP
ncbi:MAG: hypothetical protein ABIP89_18910, partial [Polyangiaceae bacterium]